MTWEIALVFLLLLAALVSFALEKVPADVTAFALMALLLVTGLLSPDKALTVFSNPAPLTIGAMFILSTALEKCGAIDMLAHRLERAARLPYPLFMTLMLATVAIVSMFINNTPVVVVFMPILVNLARKLDVPASKMLIPLSYAAILGGICTLVGTSTNILVSSIGADHGLEPFGMFEIAAVGLPLLLLGGAYIVLFGRRLLPTRETLTSILSESERREFITEAFVPHDSPQIGKTLKEAGLLGRSGLRIIEVVRNGVVQRTALDKLRLQEGDRLIIASRPSGIAATKQIEGINFIAEAGLGLEQISAHEGMLVEGVIPPNSDLIGKTILEANFRQRYRVIILAVHRRGRNVREKLSSLRLEFGDTLLLLGTEGAINNLRMSDDIMLIDRPPVSTESRRRHLPVVLAAIAGAVGLASFGVTRIEVAAFVACALLFVIGAVRPREAYSAIQWNILFLIFSMLGMGLAMQDTGAAAWLSHSVLDLVDRFVSPELRGPVMIGCIYLVTAILTELLSNNAAAAVMATIAIGVAETMGVDARPFLVAVAVGASASFSTPIGYQTNTYVYGVGGYKFTDFVKFGLPLNILALTIAVVVIPQVWSF